MCGAAVIAPLAGLAASMFSGGKSGGGVQSYNTPETELTANNPAPPTEEPTLGVDNTGGKQAGSQGKGALTITKPKRNPGVSIAGGGVGSGVNVVGR